MIPSHRGILIGGLIGIMTALVNGDEALVRAASTVGACAVLGWLIGRSIEQRKPRP